MPELSRFVYLKFKINNNNLYVIIHIIIYKYFKNCVIIVSVLNNYISFEV